MVAWIDTSVVRGKNPPLLTGATMQLLLVQPEHAERIAAFYRSNHGPEFPHQELLEGATMSRLLHDNEVALIAAVDDGKVLGCGLAFPRDWNGSLEIGSLSVDEGPRKGEVAKTLFEALRRLGHKRYGLSFFRAGTEGAFKRAREMGASPWGFRPTPGSRSLDDAELIMGFPELGGDAVRVPPPSNPITRTPFARRIIESLGSDENDLPYPSTFPVGAPRGTGTMVISGRIWPTYHSKGNYITLENSAGRFPVEIIREFVTKVRTKGVTDIRLTMPVNQDEAFAELLQIGFAPVAYLPGWYIRGAHRFDCIELVAGLPKPAGSGFVDRAAERVIRELTP